jgi:CP family cyanate transporter-like MFS transporter
VAAAIWLVPAAEAPTRLDRVPRQSLHRVAGSWSLALYFGTQSMAFYTGLTWLPSILEAHGFSEGGAGGLLALANALQFAPAFLVPVLAGRLRTQTGLLMALSLLAGGAIVGVLAWTPGAVLWMTLLGIGQGGALGLALVLPVLRGASAAAVASLTAMTLAVGYALAAFGPFIAGVLHDVTGSWTASVLFMLVVTVLEIPSGWRATREWRAGAVQD